MSSYPGEHAGVSSDRLFPVEISGFEGVCNPVFSPRAFLVRFGRKSPFLGSKIFFEPGFLSDEKRFFRPKIWVRKPIPSACR